MHRLVELVGVGVEGDADVRVARDPCHPYRIKAESQDQVRDERAAQIVRRHRGLTLTMETGLLGCLDDPVVADVVPV